MLHAERQREYRKTHKNLSAEYKRNYRSPKTQGKAQKNKTPQASTSTDPTRIPIIYNYSKPMNTFKRILLLIHLVMLDTCDRLWHE
jgi:hypothetical protein